MDETIPVWAKIGGYAIATLGLAFLIGYATLIVLGIRYLLAH